MRTYFSLLLVVGLAVLAGNAESQDLTYTYDDSGNLKTVGKSNVHNVAPPGAVTIKPPSKVLPQCLAGHCGTPDQPKLVSGGLHGHRVCGTLAGTGRSFSFDCTSPLPSNNDNGWQVTPEFWVTPDGKSHANKAVVLTVSTPTQTELFIEFEGEAGNGVEQEQVTRQPGDAEVRDVGANGQVAEAMSDDGHTRTWTLQFLLNTCTDVAKLNIYNTGSSGTTNGVRSSPLHVWLLRDPAESCS